MIADRQLTFSDAQAITVTANSTDTIDLIGAYDLSHGFPLRARINVETAFTAAGAATLQAQLVTSAAAALSAPTVLYDTTAIGKATLVAGYILMDVVVPQTAQRYLGVVYTVATGPMTAGAVMGELLLDTETPIPRRIVGNVSY